MGVGFGVVYVMIAALAAACEDERMETRIALAWLCRNLLDQTGFGEPTTSLHLLQVLGVLSARGPSPTRTEARQLRATWDLCRVYSGEWRDPTAGATLAHRHDLSPAWAEHAIPTALIGSWIFYRPR